MGVNRCPSSVPAALPRRPIGNINASSHHVAQCLALLPLELNAWCSQTPRHAGGIIRYLVSQSDSLLKVARCNVED